MRSENGCWSTEGLLFLEAVHLISIPQGVRNAQAGRGSSDHADGRPLFDRVTALPRPLLLVKAEGDPS